MERKLKLPIGIENFSKIRTEGFYYVDKTGLIIELLHNWGEVNLFTRPRRFGKSLNMSMLKCFFEIGCEQTLFDGLAITKETRLCEQYMGKFPVISISLKDISGATFETARAIMCQIIAREALRFQFLLESEQLTEAEKQQYMQLIASNQEEFWMSDATLSGSLYTLSNLLRKHYNSKVILLIDEYDVPLDKAMHTGYYDQMILLIRSLLSLALKTNDSLQFAVLTGCLRVSKESIFTGLNNLRVLSIQDVQFDEYFGFVDSEVKEMLEYYQLSTAYTSIKEWYDGYRFGNMDVYCPWDVICYCDKLRANEKAKPEAFWINSSGNDVIRHFLEMAKATTKREIEQLIAGESVEKIVRPELTYREMYDSIENVWSVLFSTGYLTRRGEADGKKLKLAIPNTEVRNIFVEQISEWFQHTARNDGATLDAFCDAFKNGDAAKAEAQFLAYLKKTISIRDTFAKKEKKENFYHGILVGLFGYKDSWDISSNHESGDGYSDILVQIEDEDIGIVIEVKYADNGDLQAACKEALEQIETLHYDERFHDAGIETILKYGIACYKKRCMVVLAE